MMMATRSGIALLTAAAFVLPAYADEERDDGLIEIMALHDVSIRRGEDKAIKERGVHVKNVSRREKHKLDRIVMLRFDSKDFADVRAVGLRLEPVNFSDYNKAMRFRVYGVLDGDEEDEKFTEKDYDPNGEGTMIDRRLSTMLNRRQVTILGNFSTEKDEPVLFSSQNLYNFVRSDSNETVTLVIVRETESWHNSTFAPRQSEKGPRLVVKLDSQDAPAEDQSPKEARIESPDADTEQQ
ncbi:MAG: hypothetical protein ACPGYV_11135 [Phycisphaeraceae bacterium]